MNVCAQRCRVAGAVFFLTLFVWGTAFVTTAQTQEFQKAPIILRASDMLPREWLTGPNYTIKEMARSDGIVNVYDVDIKSRGRDITRLRDFQVWRTPSLKTTFHRVLGISKVS